MFKKPLNSLKTSAPLRSSDRRKLKQRAVAAFGLTPEEGDNLVPEGVLSVKFNTYTDEPGTAYLESDGTPIWFTIGKGSDDLIPTIYSLWKKQDLLPFLSTTSEVIPILVGGADLMIPGVISCPPSLIPNQLVAIRRHSRKDDKPAVSPPLAIGRMALPSDEIRSAGKKGKAVLLFHTWKDRLWDMGSHPDVPEDTILSSSSGEINEQNPDPSPANEQDTVEQSAGSLSAEPGPSSASEPSKPPKSITYTPQEVTELLNMALIQAISEHLSSLPSSTFPMPATTFYSNYLLPSRPAFPTRVLIPANFVSDGSTTVDQPSPVETEITIKSSSQKSLTAFLKAAEKRGLLTLKAPQKQQPEVLVMSVNSSHPSVISHESFVTIRNLELKAAKKAAREEKQKEAEGSREVQVRELYKPHQSSVALFEGIGASKGDLYTSTQVTQLLNEYIKTRNLINQNDHGYVNLDDLLHSPCVASKGKAKAQTNVDEGKSLQFLRRDELVKTVLQTMQSWYEVRADGRDVVAKKGTISPIQVTMKVRQGRKVSTLISGFEPFLVIDAQEMADELRKTCAGATSVAPVPGKAPGSGLEVFVQGKQSKAVVDYLRSKGIQKKWIEVSDLSGKK